MLGRQLDLSNKRVLVLAPHTDDEFGCAGTISRFVRSGADVRYIAFSRCEESVPAGFPASTLEVECRACLGELGLGPDRVDVLGFRVRHFPSVRQDILEHLVKYARQWRPEIVLLPSSFDTHQDHATVFAEGFRAFKHSTLLGYEMPQNLIAFSNSAFVALEDADISLKLRSLACYKSQEFRPYSTEEFIKGLACVRGVQCDARYAEAFEVIRLMV